MTPVNRSSRRSARIQRRDHDGRPSSRVLIGWTVRLRAELNIEAYPDPTAADGRRRDPEPRPLGRGDRALHHHPDRDADLRPPEPQTIRTISLYGLSDVKLQFTFDYTYEEALQQVLNRLSQLPPLPNNAQPQISPLSPIGEIYRYKLVGPPHYSVLDLKTLQDWVLQRRFRSVPGVIDVTGWGGKTKTYELQVDFNKLIAYGLTLPQLLQSSEQQQHQCRRQHRQHRPASRGGARRRPDPLARRPRQHHADAERRQSGAGQGRRHRHGRQPAAPRHRRHGRRRRHRRRASC